MKKKRSNLLFLIAFLAWFLYGQGSDHLILSRREAAASPLWLSHMSSTCTAATVIVDANNLRGKLHFSLTLPEMVQGLMEWKDTMKVSSRMVIVMDHGAQPLPQTFSAPRGTPTTTTSSTTTTTTINNDLLLCFSGTHKSADDVIAALIPWIQNDCGHDAVVVTEDLLLRRRCRSKSQDSRQARKLRQGRAADQTLRVVTSKAFAEHLIDLRLPLLACQRNASSSPPPPPPTAATAAATAGHVPARDLAEGVDLVRRIVRQQHGKASAATTSTRKLLALLGVHDWLPAVDLLLEGYQQYCSSSRGGGGGGGTAGEESWERWLQAESYRRHLLATTSLYLDLPLLHPLKRQ